MKTKKERLLEIVRGGDLVLFITMTRENRFPKEVLDAAYMCAAIKGYPQIMGVIHDIGRREQRIYDEAAATAAACDMWRSVRRAIADGANVQYDNNIILRCAVVLGDSYEIDYLIRNGADLNSVDNDTMRVARSVGSYDTVAYIKELKRG